MFACILAMHKAHLNSIRLVGCPIFANENFKIRAMVKPITENRERVKTACKSKSFVLYSHSHWSNTFRHKNNETTHIDTRKPAKTRNSHIGFIVFCSSHKTPSHTSLISCPQRLVYSHQIIHIL